MQLPRWTQRCGICMGMGLPHEHSLLSCCRPESEKAIEWVKTKRVTMRYAKYGGCFKCGVPQAICARWTDNGKHGWQLVRDVQCQYYSVLLASMRGIQDGWAEIEVRWKQRLEELRVDSAKVERYLAGKSAIRHAGVLNLAIEFDWLTRQVDGVEEEGEVGRRIGRQSDIQGVI